MARRNPLFPYIYRLGMPLFDRLFFAVIAERR